MTTTLKRTLGLTTAIIVILAMALNVVISGAAGNASFSLSPGSGSYMPGDTLSVAINVTSADPVDAAQAKLSYNGTQLDFLSVDGSDSAFGLPVQSGDSGAVVTVIRGVSPGSGSLSGTNKLASVNFKVLAGSGSTNLSFNDDSVISKSGDDLWNHSPSTVSYSLTTPASPSPAPPSDTGTPGGSNNNSSGQSQSTAGQPSPQVIAANAEVADDQPVPVNSSNSSDPDFEGGYNIAVRVLNAQSEPVADTEVKMDNNQTARTDATGVASFFNVPAGEHTFNALGISQTVSVDKGDTNDAQTFVISQPASVNNRGKFIRYGLIALGAVGILVAAGIGITGLRGGKGGQPKLPSTDDMPGSNSVPPDLSTDSLNMDGSKVISPTSPVAADDTQPPR